MADLACSMVPFPVLKKECTDTMRTIISNNFEVIRDITDIWGPEDMCEVMHMCPRQNGKEVGFMVTWDVIERRS